MQKRYLLCPQGSAEALHWLSAVSVSPNRRSYICDQGKNSSYCNFEASEEACAVATYWCQHVHGPWVLGLVFLFFFSSLYARCCKILYILIFHFVLCSVLFVSLRLWTLMRSGTNVFEGQGQLVDWCLTQLECVFVHGYFTTVDKTMKEGRTYLHPGCQRAVMSLCSLIQVAYESGDRPQDDFHLRGLGRQYRCEAKQWCNFPSRRKRVS